VRIGKKEFLLYDRDEYLRNSGVMENASPSFNLHGHETKRLYTNVKANARKATVIIDVNGNIIQNRLSLPFRRMIICSGMIAEEAFSSYDEAFEAVRESHEPKTGKMALDRFYDKLRNLCYNYKWENVKSRVETLLEWMPHQLSIDPGVFYFLRFIAMIVNSFSEQTRNIIAGKWMGELEEMYLDHRFDDNPKIIEIIQELLEYDADFVRKLIDEASSPERWSEEKFRALEASIGFGELKKRDLDGYRWILKYLIRKMNASEKDNAVYERLKVLYHGAELAG
jgi:hypothetical protein